MLKRLFISTEWHSYDWKDKKKKKLNKTWNVVSTRGAKIWDILEQELVKLYDYEII